MAESLGELKVGSGARRNGPAAVAHPVDADDSVGAETPGVDRAGVEAAGYDSGLRGRSLSADELNRQIDALSLEQALIDFERANARVLDLTARLVESQKRVLDVQAETDRLRAEIGTLREAVTASEARTAEIVSSRAYRWSSRMVAIRSALRG